MSLSIREAVQLQEALAAVADLRARMATLEAQIAGRTAPAPLAKLNVSRQTHAQRLRQAIARVLADHPEPGVLTAKEIGRALERSGFDRLPAERTLRLHLAAIRGNGNTLRDAAAAVAQAALQPHTLTHACTDQPVAPRGVFDR